MLCATELEKALFDGNLANLDENTANLKQADCMFMCNRVGQSFDVMCNRVGQSFDVMCNRVGQSFV